VFEEQAERKEELIRKERRFYAFITSKYLIFSTVSTVPNLEKNSD
jgi:hypothetical protein